MWDGLRPNHTIAKTCQQSDEKYQPMRKEGAIILATGGDQSDGAVGNFYEGVMATGATSNVDGRRYPGEYYRCWLQTAVASQPAS